MTSILIFKELRSLSVTFSFDGVALGGSDDGIDTVVSSLSSHSLDPCDMNLAYIFQP